LVWAWKEKLIKFFDIFPFILVKLNSLFHEKMPKSTAYLFEVKRYKARDLKLLPYILKLKTCEVIMQSVVKSSLLAANTNGKEESSRLFRLNPNRVAHHFHLLLGNERVKTSDLVHLLINQGTEVGVPALQSDLLNKLILKVPTEIRHAFNNSMHRESLSLNFLQASVFLKIKRDVLPE
jgi:hypothetical protein